jgi:hypothetical protein
MLAGASYSNHLIDLSGTMSYLLILFAGIKLVTAMSHASAAAVPGYRTARINSNARHILLLGIRTDIGESISISGVEKRLFAAVGLGNVIRINDLLGGNNFLSKFLSSYVAFIILADDHQRTDLVTEYKTLPSKNLLLSEAELTPGTDIESSTFKSKVTGLLTGNAASLFSI